MFPICLGRVVSAEFLVYVFTNLDIHVFTDDENDLFRDATYKGIYLVIESDVDSFFTNICRVVTRDGCCVEVAIKSS